MDAELLAPAGSWEAMEGAIGAGADAVYVGGPLFGARAYAPNLSVEELCRAVEYVHLRKCRLYLTVNTLLKNKELFCQLEDYLSPLYQQGLDAVIVQDLGVFAFIRERFPDLPIHASTQMGITGVNSARMLEEAGAVRIVAARELSLGELRQIREGTSLEIEAFVHGALCYSYSGQCLFSSMLGGRSGNRGRCAQPCRLTYQAGDKKGQLLSPKDICTLELLPEILKAGVYSLKIEGRMKQPEYVAGVTSIYRKYLDLCLEGRDWDPETLKRDKDFLKDLFSRGGFCTGYLKGSPGPSMITFKNEKKTGTCPVKIRKRKEKIKGYLMLSSDSRAILEVSFGGYTATVMGSVPERAAKQPTDRERILGQIRRTGDTAFEFGELRLDMEEDLFIPVSQLNSLRRDGIRALEEKVLQEFRRPGGVSGTKILTEKNTKKDRVGVKAEAKDVVMAASCETLAQWKALASMDKIRELYLPIPLFEQICGQQGGAYFQDLAQRREWFLALPHIIRPRDLDGVFQACSQALSYGCKGFLVRNLESFAFLAGKGWAGICHLDAGLYTYNDRAVEFWREQGAAAFMVPFELNQKELAHRDNAQSYMMVYGHIPLMLSAQCIQKNTKKCDGKSRILVLKDRYKKEFPVQCCCDLCYNIIYNSLPYGLPGYQDTLRGMGLYRYFLSFTLESGAQTRKVAEAFLRGQGPEGFTFTKGHMKRGVE